MCHYCLGILLHVQCGTQTSVLPEWSLQLHFSTRESKIQTLTSCSCKEFHEHLSSMTGQWRVFDKLVVWHCGLLTWGEKNARTEIIKHPNYLLTCRADRAGLWPRLDWMFLTREGDLQKQKNGFTLGMKKKILIMQTMKNFRPPQLSGVFGLSIWPSEILVSAIAPEWVVECL